MRKHSALFASCLILTLCIAYGASSLEDSKTESKVDTQNHQPVKTDSNKLTTLCFVAPNYENLYAAEHNKKIKPAKLSEKEINLTLGFLKKHFPISYNHAISLKKKAPKKFTKYIFVAHQKITQLEKLTEKRRTVQLDFAKTNIAIYLTSKKFRAEKDKTKKSDLQKKLKTLLERHFVLEQQIKQFQVQDLESHMKVLTGQIKKRDTDKNKILKSRLKLLESGKIKNPSALGNPIPNSELKLVTTPKPID